MIDYKEEMILLFSQYYSPIGEEYQKKFMSTFQVYAMFKGILPSEPFSEHEAYEILKELGFKQEMELITNEEILVEESDEVDEEKDTHVIGRVFKWVVYEKDLN